MKTYVDKWFGDYSFHVYNYRKAWEENGNKPRLNFHTNGAKRGNPNHSCLDVSLTLGYVIINFVNWNFNKRYR